LCGHFPGKNWLARFLAHHKSKLCFCASYSLDPKHARSFNFPVVHDYFGKLNAVIHEHNIPPENIYNMDEKGCQLGGGCKKACTKYLYGQQSHEAYHVRDTNLELATIVECVSADGHALKPYIIFKGK